MWITRPSDSNLPRSAGAMRGGVMEADLVYYRCRLAEETAAAAAARDSKVSAVHLELARIYGERLGSLEVTCHESPLHLVSAA